MTKLTSRWMRAVCCALWFTCLEYGSAHAGPEPAVRFTNYNAFVQGGYTLGWVFTVETPLDVSSLGFFDAQSDGLLGSHPVALWTSSGTLLASTIVPSGNAAPLVDGFRYVPIAPVRLEPGSYVIAALANNTDAFWASVTGLATSPLLTYDRAVFTAGSALAFPTNTGPTASYFGAGMLVAPAASAFKWRQVAPPIAPSPRAGHKLVYDSVNRKVLLFGGEAPNGALFNDTWEFDTATETWTDVTPTGTPLPSPRSRFAMAFDPVRQVVVVYGGHVADNPGTNDQTWEWNPATRRWSFRGTAGIIDFAGRVGAELAFDPNLNQLILFGGVPYWGCPTGGGTFAWNGTAWTLVGSGGPAGLVHHSLATDITRGRVVLYGGMSADCSIVSDFSDTWEWDGGTWTKVATSPNRPSVNRAVAFEFDAARHEIVTFGGQTTSGSWTWNGLEWQLAPSAGAPSPRLSSLVFDPSTDRFVVFGGSVGAPLSARDEGIGGGVGDTWIASRRQATSLAIAPVSAPYRGTFDATARLTTEHGSPIANATLHFHLGSADYQATTDDDGVARMTLPVDTRPVGSYELTVTFDGAALFEPAAGVTTLTVHKAVPVVSWLTPASIGYGTPLASAQLNASAAVAGTLTYVPAAGTVLSAGTHTLMATFAPDDPGYETLNKYVVLTVTQATPTLSWSTPAAIVYGTALGPAQLAAQANIPGTFTYLPAAGAILPAGTPRLDAVFTPVDAQNYQIAHVSVALTVLKAPSVVTWSSPASIEYGTVLGAAQLNPTAGVPGSFTYSPAAGTLLNPGTHGLNVTFVPSDQTNYLPASASVSLLVKPATTNVALTSGLVTPFRHLVLRLAGDVRTASLASGAATPTGTIEFLEGGVSLGTITVGTNTAGMAAMMLLPSAGPHAYTARYSGDARFAPSEGTLGPLTLDPPRAGALRAWGNDYFGQLGDGNTNVNQPFAMTARNADGSPIVDVVTMAAGARHTLVIRADGTLWAWGANWYGEVGDGTVVASTKPVPVLHANGLPFKDAVAVGADDVHSVALKRDGTVWAWGLGATGQLGNGATSPSPFPVQVTKADGTPLSGIVAIKTASVTNVALRFDGTVWTWGNNIEGQLGDGTTTQRLRANQVLTAPGQPLSNVMSIWAGYHAAFAVSLDGSTWAWGRNAYGQLGVGSQIDQLFASLVKNNDGTPFTGVFRIAAGAFHTLAVRQDLSLWSWGYNYNGQLGVGTASGFRLNPGVVLKQDGSPFTGAVEVGAGADSSLALGNDGRVWGFGGNSSAQLGDGTLVQRVFPTPVRDTWDGAPLLNAFAIVAQFQEGLALVDRPSFSIEGTLDFGEQRVGTVVDDTVVIRSTGAGVLRLGSMSLSGSTAGLTITQDLCTNALLSPGWACSLTVRFSPSTVGVRSPTLAMLTNADAGLAKPFIAARAFDIPTITWATPAAIAYGAPLNTVQLNAAANVPGTFTYTPTLSAILPAGTHQLSAQFTPADSVGYHSTSATVALVVNKAVPTFTLVGGGTFVFDGQPHVVTASGTGALGETLTPVNLSYTPAGTTAPTAAGLYTATASYAGSQNYLPGSDGVKITIVQAIPTITLHDTTVVYNGATRPVPGTIVGVLGESLGPLVVSYRPTQAGTKPPGDPQAPAPPAGGGGDPVGTLDDSWSQTAPTNAGEYDVRADFAGSVNYAARTAQARLTIERAIPMVNVAGATFTYDGRPHIASAFVTGVGGEDLGTAIVLYDGVSAAPIDAGTYVATASFEQTANYKAAAGSAQLIIQPAVPTIAVTGLAFVYDAQPHPATVAATGVSGEPLEAPALTYSGGAVPLAAGTYRVTASYPGARNYQAATATADLSIAKAVATVSVNGGTFGYDGQPHAAAARVTGVAGEDLGGLVVTYNGTPTAPANAGTYEVVANFGGTNNYLAATGSAVLRIQPGAPTISVNGLVVDYDGLPHPASGTVVGVNGASLGTLTFTYNGASVVPVGAGTYQVVGHFAGAANYTAGTATAVISILKIPLTVTAVNATKIYGQPKPPLSVTYAGFVGGDTSASLGGSLSFGTAAGDASPVGTYAVTPSGLTSTNYAIQFVAGTMTVTKAASSVTLRSSSNPAGYQQPIALTADVVPSPPGAGVATGTVEFFEGTVSKGTSTVVQGQAILNLILDPGTHLITARYSGDDNVTIGESALSQVVNPRNGSTSTKLTIKPGTANVGDPVEFRVDISGLSAVPAGLVELREGTTTVASARLLNNPYVIWTNVDINPTPGSHAYVAVYLGDEPSGTPGSTSLPTMLTVLDGVALQKTNLRLSPSKPLSTDTPVIVDIRVDGPGSTPAGVVLLSVDGAPGISVPLAASGQSESTATWNVGILTAGTHQLTATYVGDSTHAGSTKSIEVTIRK